MQVVANINLHDDAVLYMLQIFHRQTFLEETILLALFI